MMERKRERQPNGKQAKRFTWSRFLCSFGCGFFFASVNILCPELFPFQLFSDLHIAIPVLAVIISIIFFNLCYCFCFGTPIFWWIKWRKTKIDGACITKKIAFEAKKNTRANKRNSWYWNIIRINENGNGNGKWNSQIVVLSM